MNRSALLPFGSKSSILVCESDGFYFRATVMVRAGKELVALHSTESHQADMDDTVREVLQNLKRQGWSGKQAILLSPSVLSTLIELPVNPKKPRPLPQMMDLVRWEAEPLLAQHTTQWSVGNLLVSRGYMTAEQAAAVLDLQQGKANPAGGLALSEQFSFRRFGELAEELGYIKRSQLNACLAGQEWLKSDDETLECGWSPQGEVADIPGTFNWLISCVNKTLLARWTAIFQQHGLTLKAMYPLTGCSTVLLPSTPDAAVMLESHSGQAMAVQLKNDVIIEQHLLIDPEKPPLDCCLESFHTLNLDKAPAVWFADGQADNDALAIEIKQALGCEDFHLLDQKPVDEHVSPGMLAAAMHYLQFPGSHRLASVEPGGPSPAFWQRFEVRLGAAMAAALCIILGLESYFYLQTQSLESKKADLEQQWQLVSKAMKSVKADIQQIEQRKKELKKNQQRYQKEKLTVTFFGESLPQRADLVEAILGVLQQVVTDEVIIESIDEDPRRVTLMPVNNRNLTDPRVEVENFNLKAWAATETAAQTFIQAIQDALAPWDMEIRDNQVIARPGPLNLDGFAITMRLVKLRDAEAVKKEVTVQ